MIRSLSKNASSNSDDSEDEHIDEGVNNEPHLCDSSSSISDSDGASIIIYMSLLFMYVHAQGWLKHFLKNWSDYSQASTVQ